MLRISEYRKVLGEDGKSIKLEKIDLKELEKFGFEKYQISSNKGLKDKYKLKILSGGHEINNYIIGEDRIIHYNQMSVNNELDNTLYDLIKADMVEKV